MTASRGTAGMPGDADASRDINGEPRPAMT
jgi:hypothetical protein